MTSNVNYGYSYQGYMPSFDDEHRITDIVRNRNLISPTSNPFEIIMRKSIITMIYQYIQTKNQLSNNKRLQIRSTVIQIFVDPFKILSLVSIIQILDQITIFIRTRLSLFTMSPSTFSRDLSSSTMKPLKTDRRRISDFGMIKIQRNIAS